MSETPLEDQAEIERIKRRHPFLESLGSEMILEGRAEITADVLHDLMYAYKAEQWQQPVFIRGIGNCELQFSAGGGYNLLAMIRENRPMPPVWRMGMVFFQRINESFGFLFVKCDMPDSQDVQNIVRGLAAYLSIRTGLPLKSNQSARTNAEHSPIAEVGRPHESASPVDAQSPNPSKTETDSISRDDVWDSPLILFSAPIFFVIGVVLIASFLPSANQISVIIVWALICIVYLFALLLHQGKMSEEGIFKWLSDAWKVLLATLFNRK